MNECIESNTIGTNEVFNFCLKNKIKLIYSTTSASIGNRGNDEIYHHMLLKSKNLEMLENLKKWFNFKFEVIFLQCIRSKSNKIWGYGYSYWYLRRAI